MTPEEMLQWARRPMPVTGPTAAIRATSPASPYARDRIEAPSNRPAPREPTLRSRTQDVLRSAPGALTTARERQVYDTTPQDVVRGAQELTGLPSLARGAGGLVGLATQAGSGFLGPQHALPAAGAVFETAMGLAPLAGVRGAPRGALRAPVARGETPLNVQYERASSFNHGPFAAEFFEASPSRINLLEMGTDTAARGQGHARRGMQEFLRNHGDRDIYLTPSPTEPPYDVGRLERFYGSLGFEPVPGGADTFAWRRLAQPAQRIPNMAREIGPNGMPVAQSQPYRNSLRGGSADLREAAGMGAAPEAPPQVFEAFHNSPRGGIRRLRGNRSGPDHFHGRGVYLSTDQPNADWGPNTYRVQVRGALSDFPHAGASLSEGDLLSRFQQAAQGRVDLLPQLSVGDAYGRLAEVMPGWTTKGRELAASRALARAGVPGIAAEFAHPQIVVFDDAAMQIVERTKTPRPRTPPPTTPTGTAPFGDPRAYPPSTWEEFGSRQGGTPEARLRAQEQGFDTGRVLYHGTRSDFDAFDASMSRTGDVPLGVHLGTTPDQANTVNTTGRIERNRTGMDYVEGARNMPVYARVSNPLRMEDPTNWGTNEILSQIAWNDPPISIPKPSYDVTPTDIRDAIRGAGYDSIVYRNAHEGAGDSYIVLPDADGQVRNIRSIFAAFDPAKRDSSDLLAGLTAAAPIPIAASALTQQQNTTGRPRGRPGFFGGR